ncbi:MAG: carboxypeptidase-like regulatory domain-containing protein, partial [bacterium]
SNGDVCNGTVMINAGLPEETGILVLSFMNDFIFDLNNWGSVVYLNSAGPFDGSTASNPYQFATPLGSTVQLMIGIYCPLSRGNESFTVIESVTDIDGGGTYNFTCDNIGSTIDGYVTRDGEPVYWATIAMYRETDNRFAGFARTNKHGYYSLINVPNGSYWLGITAEDYDCIEKTAYFSVNEDLRLETIELSGCEFDFDHDGDVDGSDLAIFSSQLINESELAAFASEYGRIN